MIDDQILPEIFNIRQFLAEFHFPRSVVSNATVQPLHNNISFMRKISRNSNAINLQQLKNYQNRIIAAQLFPWYNLIRNNSITSASI